MSNKSHNTDSVAAHDEHHAPVSGTTNEPITGFDAETSNVPKGYFYSPYFLGSMAAIGLSLMGSVGGFALAAPILGFINADIGPDPNITWVPLVFPLGLAVGLTLVGRLSDLFGRRWFFTGGQALGCIGAIVCATAKSVPTLIGGTAIVGLAASTALSFSFLTGELVPMKYRFIGTSYAYLWVIPFSGLAPAIANSLVVNASWRWCYYLMIIFDGLAFVAYFFFYHPPTFEMKHRSATRAAFVRNFDYIGTVLFTGGMVVFLLGISWGGSVYPWKSAAVISTVIIGALALVGFVAWECLADLKEPLVPMHLFRNRDYNITCGLLAIGASVYYAFGIVWPSMVNVIYAGGDPIYAGWLQCCVGGAFTLGQVVGGFVCKAIGNSRLQIILVTTVGGALLAGNAAATLDNVSLPIGLLVVGNFAIGWMESLAQTLCGICVNDQKEIGIAVGIAGSIRSAISTLASTIYVVVLNNRLAETVPAAVGPAATAAGLPDNSLPSLLSALAVGTQDAFDAVQGLNPHILSVSQRAYQEGNRLAFQTVFYVSIAFSGIAVILSFWAPNVDNLMTDQIATILKHDKRPAADVEMSDAKLEQKE